MAIDDVCADVEDNAKEWQHKKPMKWEGGYPPQPGNALVVLRRQGSVKLGNRSDLRLVHEPPPKVTRSHIELAGSVEHSAGYKWSATIPSSPRLRRGVARPQLQGSSTPRPPGASSG